MKKSILLFVFYLTAIAQSNSFWDLSFTEPKTGNGVDGTVVDIAVVDDNIYIAGSFKYYDISEQKSYAANFIKYNTTNHTFEKLTPDNKNYSINGGVIRAITIVGNYLYCAGGNLQFYDGNQTIYTYTMFRINLNTKEWEKVEGAPASGTIYKMKLIGNRLFFGGRFVGTNEIPIHKIGFLNINNMQFYSLGNGINTASDSYVRDFDTDGEKLYVIGQFSNYSNINRENFAVFDLTSFQWIDYKLEISYSPASSIVYHNGKLYISGQIQQITYNDTIYDVNSFFEFDLISKKVNNINLPYPIDSITNITLYKFGNNLFLNISPYFQPTYFPLWEYNLINKTLTPLNIKFKTIYPLTLAYNIKFLDVDKYVIYGDFLSINDIPLFRIALYDKQKDLLIPVGSKGGKGINGRVHDIKLYNNKLYIAGNFDKVHNYSFKNLTMLDLNNMTYTGYLGHYDDGLKPSGSYITIEHDINGKINSLEVDSIFIYIAGEFTKIKNSTIFGLAKYNLKSRQWSTITGDGNNYWVGATNYLKIIDDNLYFGTSSINTLGQTQIKYIGRYNIKENKLYSIGVAENNGTNGPVNTIVKIGNYLYVGGNFTTAGTINCKNIAKFNLQTNTWEQIASPPYEGPEGEIYTLYYSPSRNKLFVGGNFSSIGSYITKNFAIFDLSTNQWLPNSTYLFNGFNNIVNHIDEKGDYIIVGGNFTKVDGSGYDDKNFFSIAVHENSTNTWTTLGTDNGQGTSGLVTKFIIDSNRTFIVGEFDNVNLLNSIESKNIAILYNNHLIGTENSNVIKSFKVYENYPNPFNPSTYIKFEIPKPGYIKVNIYDITGKLLMNLHNGYTDKQTHNLHVDMKNFTSGIYIYTIEYNNQRISKKMVLLK